MNILAFDLPYCNHHNLVSLVKSGHTVYRCGYGEQSYIESLGVKRVPGFDYHDYLNHSDKHGVVSNIISDLNIELIINSDPSEGWIWKDFHSELPYIGPCSYVSSMEVRRMECKEFVQNCGVKVPEILGTFHSRDFDSTKFQKPLVVKPIQRYCSAIVCQPGQDDDLRLALEKEYPHEIYVEEYMANSREVSMNYTIIDGEYLTYVYHYDANCQYNYGPSRREVRDWHQDIYSEPLDPESEQINILNGEKIIAELAKYPGNHEGHLSGYITPDGEWYFGELGVRRYSHNSVPNLMTGDQWLECMLGDMDTYKSVWQGTEIIQVIIQTSYPEDRYPIELHDTYPEIFPPGGLLDTFQTNMGGAIISSLEQNRSVMDRFIHELETSTRFTANRPY